MKLFLLPVLFCSVVVSSKAQNAEQVIRNYFLGYENKDWNLVTSQLADGFTFTSPNHDDQIPLATYKERCWWNSKLTKKVEFTKIIVQGDCAFATYNLTTTDNKIVRNTEYYTFSHGKIKSIECFFGPGPGYPGNTKTN
jgi:hypothetical protein